VGDFDFKVIFATKDSNKFQKTRFWKEKSVENMVTLEGLPFDARMISFHIWLLKKSIQHVNKQCSHVEFAYFVMVHNWANDTCHTSIM
jgi:hypothetical protein